MSMITFSSRDFNHDTSGAKKAANNGPVFITDRGRPAHVLLTISDYENLVGGRMTLLDAVAQTKEGDFDFVPPRLKGPLSRTADLS